MPKPKSTTLRSLPIPLTLTLLLTLLTLPIQTTARCCFPDSDTRCADGNALVGWCCGHGSCNIFCCNCDGGCLGSPATKPHGAGGVEAGTDAAQYEVCIASTGASIFSGDEDCGAQLFHALDFQGTGRLSVEQYLNWYKGVGVGASASAGEVGKADDDNEDDDEFMIGAKQYFLSFDANGDGFVDEEEMHRAVGG